MTNMAFRPKMNDAMDEVVDLRPQNAQPGPSRKPDMRVDFSTLGNSELASKLPGFLEEMARANRETEELMAADPKAARIEIDGDEEVETQVIEMNLYSGVLEAEEPKKEIVMPNGQPLAGDGVNGDSDVEPFISEPVKVRHTTNNNRKRRASSSSCFSSNSGSSSSSSSSSEGETRIIKIQILERDGAREGTPDSQASADSADSSSSSSSKGSMTRIPRDPHHGEPEQLIVNKLYKSPPPRSKSGSPAAASETSPREPTPPPTKRIVVKGRSPSPPVHKGQDVQNWINDQPSATGDYREIAGTPSRKMPVPISRLEAKQSQKNVQAWVDDQTDQQEKEAATRRVTRSA
ncbi:hypothetical protein B0H65DRAFT_102393 [Neurospora tetraspora]|uniref:Uncharacterized protein n=1 Tax=Neurospora tetraspora TaxID=94610 RepID=A0AAE0JK95_9PEZI|nr:hypothetical protein B0H65DRAFT_102393 [Neurospora tetraspora]